jgi:hypothetical protein
MATPFRNPSFTTPRKPFDATPFSDTSAMDSSPAGAIETDADAEDTPEVKASRRDMVMFTSSKKAQPAPMFTKALATPGNLRGRDDVRRKLYDGQKVRKRKRHERDPRAAYYDTESSDDERPRSRSAKDNALAAPLAPQSGIIARSLDLISDRPSLPFILTYWVSFLFTLCTTLGVLWLLYQIWSTVQHDLSAAAAAEVSKVISEMGACADHYTRNRCDPQSRIPAMEEMCRQWEVCMNQNPEEVGRTKVSAKMLAQVITSFCEPFSWKAITVGGFLFLAVWGTSNAAKGMARSRNDYHPPPPQPPPQHWYAQGGQGQMGWAQSPMPQLQGGGGDWGYGMPPQTPSAQRQVSGGSFEAFPSILPAQTPHRNGSPRKASGKWQ